MENFNQKRKINIIDVFLFLLFVILTIFLIINIVELSNIENFLRYIVVIILVLVFALMIIFYKHRKLLCRVVMILLFFLYGFLNNTFYRVYSSIDNMTTKVDTKVICLVTSLENVVDIDSMTEGEIGIINESMDLVANEFAIDVLESEGLNNSLVQYSDYLQIIFSSEEEFINFSNMLIARSEYNFNTLVSGNDKLLTLSTCYNNDTERVVLHAKLIKKEAK